jgi:PleD family two-component response regulator
VVLMLTSDNRAGDVARGRELGIAAYLVKPVKRASSSKRSMRPAQAPRSSWSPPRRRLRKSPRRARGCASSSPRTRPTTSC